MLRRRPAASSQQPAASSQGQYDLVCAFECIHDMSDPVGVLRAMRKLAGPGGRVIVMDERCAEEFGAVGDLMKRVFYSFSLTVCLPDGMSQKPSAGTGTVMRPSTLDAYARKAGFARAEVLPLEHVTFRFYDLVLPT
jgi:2-polyprenyl-3-methyl-5-hydroxy-6-metoxy-1,4-benzoquinol methylase